MKKTNYLLIPVIFLFALTLRSFNLGRGYFGDEAITMSSASQELSGIIPSLVKNDANPPMTFFLLRLWMNISANEIFIRFYFILFGLGVLLMVYLIGREGVNRKVALLALFLGAFSPLLISLSQFIRNYIDSAFWMLMSDYFLLLIIKSKDNKLVWFGYFVSALFSIYSFYFSFILVFSQSIYIFIFKFKEKATLKKWVFTQVCILILFIPWIKYFILQLSNKGSSRFMHWENFAFKLAGIDLGIYTRNIWSLFGMDYFFMIFPEGIKNHFGLPMLLFLTFLAVGSAGLFLFLAIKWLKDKFYDNQKIVWFFIFTSVLPLFIAWSSIKVLGTLPNTRYLAALHAIFLILIANFLWTLIIRYKKTGIFFFVCLVFLYSLRITAAVAPLYDGRKVLEYLRVNLKEGDCMVMVDRLPGRNSLIIPCFNIEDYLFRQDPLTSEYLSLPENNTEKIRESLMTFKRIWFIRCYGNVEALGGNRICYNFLKHTGRKETASREFSNIKVILME